jgi:hypothetical protein
VHWALELDLSVKVLVYWALEVELSVQVLVHWAEPGLSAQV